ncbi:MAG: GAF domain-containing protein, partial [Chloroflexota bacterium]
MSTAFTDPNVMPPQDERIDVLFDMVQEVNQGAGPERIFEVIAKTLRGVFRIDRFALVLAQESGLELTLSLGLSDHYLQLARSHMESAAGARSLADRKPVYIADAASSEDFWPLQEAARAEGFHTVLILPFFAGREPLGYLIMYHNDTRSYTPSELMLAQALAQQAAFAVHQGQVLARAENQRMDIEEAFRLRVRESEALDGIMLTVASSLDLENTLQSVTDAAAALSEAEMASIYLRNDDGMYRAVHTHGASLPELQRVAIGPADGLMAQMCQHGEPVQVTDFPATVNTTVLAKRLVEGVGARSVLAVPMMAGNDCIGALYVARQRSESFLPESIRVLRRLSSFAQVAVQNALRFSGVEEERKRLQAYLDAIPESISVYDRECRVILSNA